MLVEEAVEILDELGIPIEGLTARRKQKMAKVFLSVAAMKPGMSWSEARADHRLRTRDIIRWMNANFEEDISSGSYDDIRRKDLLYPVEAGIVLSSAGKESASTNDGTRQYAINPALLNVFNAYGHHREVPAAVWIWRERPLCW